MEPTPQKIGKYDIVAPLGQGAMGVVYKAFDPLIKRHVALKTIQPGFLSPQEEDASTRFQREAQAAGNLNHPNIVAIYEYGEDAGRAFIAMEYVEGRTLGDLFNQNHRFDLAEIKKILSGVLSALAYSHRMGVIHRDIKPGNIMLDNAGLVKVMDFGVARLQSSDLTLTGTILGTPGYMSPEQLMGETVDMRSDLYSTGIVLYELLTGERAFTGSSFSSVIYKVFNSELAPPSRLKPTVPGTLDEIVSRACAKRADDRYQTAAEFIAALEQALATAAPAGSTAADDTPTMLSTKSIDAPSATKRKTMSGIKWVATAAGGLMIAIVLAFWLIPPAEKKIIKKSEVLREVPFTDCEGCPEMVAIPAGQFFQGSSHTDKKHQDNESPRRLVEINYELAISRFEITRGQFAKFAADTGFNESGCATYSGTWALSDNHNWQTPGFEQADSHPVTCVSWHDANAYVNWLSQKSGQAYRLPSASEWEYVARAESLKSEDQSTESMGTCQSANVADLSSSDTYPGWNIFDCRDNYVYTAPVGSFQANSFGIHDMIGNAFEWVADCWNDNYDAAPRDGSAWLKGDCDQRVLRGGSWFTTPEYVRATRNPKLLLR